MPTSESLGKPKGGIGMARNRNAQNSDKSRVDTSRRGYGWLHVGDGSRPKFVIREDRVHRVRLVIHGDEEFSVRCSRFQCGFRRDGIRSLAEAQEIAEMHTLSGNEKDKKKKKKNRKARRSRNRIARIYLSNLCPISFMSMAENRRPGAVPKSP